MIVCGALAAALFVALPASARLSGAVVGTPLTTCVLRAQPDMSARQLFATPQRFDCKTAQSAFGKGDYWVISQPLVGIAHLDRHTRARVASLWQRHITLYALYPDGRIRAYPLNNRQMSWHMQLGAMLEWGLPDRSAPPVRLMWHIEGAANIRGIVAMPRLATPHESEDANLSMGGIYAAFGGLCIALLAYNLAMWGALRYRFQIAYCAMVATLAGYALTSSAALVWLFPNFPSDMRLRCNYALLAVAACSGLIFAQAFFEKRVSAGWIGRLCRTAMTGVLMATAAIVIITPARLPVLDRIYALSFGLMLFTILAIVYRAWRLRSPNVWLFTAAWSAPLIFSTARMVANLGLVQWTFWLDNSTILSMAAEAIISTAAIAYRIRLLSVERDLAREREIAARILADTDPLTGLMNRRSFLPKVTGLQEQQLLMLIDIDHFKQVNETLGHDGGDEVLRVFARTLRTAIDDKALVARIGGEEFAVVVPAVGATEPEALLAALRTARMPFDVTVTASIGSCVGPLASDLDWKRLYRQADRALFAAKSAGRDRARRFEECALAAA